MARHGGERTLNHSLPIAASGMLQQQQQVNGCSGMNGDGGSSSPLSPSRIPRPTAAQSPTTTTTPPPNSFRRSSSLRLKGERGFGSSLRSPTSDYHRTHNQDLFPAINENDVPLAPFRRSNSSLSLTPARGRSGRLSRGSASGPEDCSDAESVKSYGSNYSTASACDHASFALNGTTWSGRSQRYIVHCSSHALAADSDEYLTPTQRAARQVRRYQNLLREARKEIEEKEREIFRLTKEVVELRLYKASLNSPDEKTDSSETATVRENNPFSPAEEISPDDSTAAAAAAGGSGDGSLLASPRTPDKKAVGDSSLVDSGHFDDGSLHSARAAADESCVSTATSGSLGPTPGRDDEQLRSSGGSPATLPPPKDASAGEERRRLVDHYESRIEEMHRRHVDELQSLKQSHNDKVESLLNQIVELNTSYCETRPSLEAAEARNKQLEVEVEALRSELAEQKALLADQEERNKKVYLKMYSQGQQAARMEQADQVMVLDPSPKSPSKISVAELLQQLTVTQAELDNVKPFQEPSHSSDSLALATRSQSLLSVQEAVSLWVLGTRKAMYRRIVELRNSQGALDPEITLQFLKSAVYYFLTDKENLHGHLNAIESILGFTDSEKLNIDRIYRSARK